MAVRTVSLSMLNDDQILNADALSATTPEGEHICELLPVRLAHGRAPMAPPYEIISYTVPVDAVQLPSLLRRVLKLRGWLHEEALALMNAD